MHFTWSGGYVMEFKEDNVINFIKEWLIQDGYEVKTAMGKSHGVDIEAIKDGTVWLIEAKGNNKTYQAAQSNGFLTALGQILQRYNSTENKYSIAVPDTPQYRGLWERLPSLAKTTLGLSILFVNYDGSIIELNEP